MEQWQDELQSALQDRDIERSKDILFQAYFKTSDPTGASSSLMHKGTSNAIAQILDEVDPQTQQWIQEQLSQ